MKRDFVGILCFLMMVGLMCTIGAGQATSEEICIDTGSITLKAPADVETKRSDVEFPHGVHFDYSCKKCHHTWNGETEISGCSASGCHDSSTSLLKTDPDQDFRYYKKAYHDKCISCHKTIKASNEELELSKKEIKTPLPRTGPVGCVQCHPKN